jgi:hypothetical protein
MLPRKLFSRSLKNFAIAKYRATFSVWSPDSRLTPIHAPLSGDKESAESPETRQLTVQVYGDGSLAWTIKEVTGQQIDFELGCGGAARKSFGTERQF